MTNRERFFMVDVDRDGLLLDLESGLLVHLNSSASLVWRAHLRGLPGDAIARQLSEQYRIPEEQALKDAATALQFEPIAGPTEPPGEYVYRHTQDGYLFSQVEVPILVIDDQGRFLRRAVGAPVSEQEIWQCLHGVAPKLLALRGETVLHASAVRLGRGVVIFSGLSGAGKTTTSRALVSAGAGAVCEDKLVVRFEGDEVRAVLDTERVVAHWVDQAAASLAQGQAASCDGLVTTDRDAAAVITEAGFISASGRSGNQLSARRLSVAEATGAFFSNSFHGSKDPEDWKRHLAISLRMARRVAAFALSMPDGLTELAAAATILVQSGAIRP